MMKILAILALAATAKAQSYLATAVFKEVANSDGKVLNGDRCDKFNIFGTHCDMIIDVCFEDATDSSSNINICNGLDKRSNVLKSDSNDVTLQNNYYYGDLPNPMRYIRQSAYNGVVMKVRIYDANFGIDNQPDSLIDQWMRTIHVPANGQAVSMTIHHQRSPANGVTLGSTKVSFSLSVQCLGGSACVPTTMPTTTTTTPPPTTVPSCNLATTSFDILTMIDASGYMGRSNYKAVQNFLESWLRSFTPGTGNGQTEFSSGYYASDANAWLLWYQQDSYSHWFANLEHWAYVGGSKNLLSSGMNDLQIVTQRQGFRTSAKNVAIIIGPGSNNGGDNGAAIGFANTLRQQGVTVLALAIGNGAGSNAAFLAQLAGSSSNVLQVTASTIQSPSTTSWLNSKLCSL